MNSDRFTTFFKPRYLFLATIFVAAVCYLWQLQALPFADYDEATYAQVTTETLASGDLGTLQYLGKPWFEKPALDLWLALWTTRIFGTDEWAFRLPSALLAILAIAFVWLIAYRLKDARVATLAAIVLLASPFYYLNSRQVRLDIPALAMMLGAVWALIYGWRNKNFLYLVAPFLALALMVLVKENPTLARRGAWYDYCHPLALV